MQHARGETAREGSIGARLRPAGFKWLLSLILLNFVVSGFGDFHPLMRSVNLWIAAATLALALYVSGVSRGYLLTVASLAIVTATAWKHTLGGNGLLEFIVVASFNIVTALAPISILRKVKREYSQEGVDAEVVLGALCAYLYIGSWFAVIYRSVGVLAKAPFFAQPGSETMLNYVYFSLTTLTTTGFGDLSPAYGPGRVLTAVEAVIGQLYLVSVVAIVVSAYRKRR